VGQPANCNIPKKQRPLLCTGDVQNVVGRGEEADGRKTKADADLQGTAKTVVPAQIFRQVHSQDEVDLLLDCSCIYNSVHTSREALRAYILQG